MESVAYNSEQLVNYISEEYEADKDLVQEAVNKFFPTLVTDDTLPQQVKDDLDTAADYLYEHPEFWKD